MAISLKHAFTSAKSDGGDTSLVRPSNWNAEHNLTCATGVILGRLTAGTGAVEELGIDYLTDPIIIACSDETTALTAGTAKVTFRMPFAFTLTEVPRASLTTAQTSGSIFTVDINEGGTSILSTKITIDNSEKTSTTAATQPVLSDTALANDAEITVDIDQIGASGAAGLKIALIGRRA
jgi:hypothetical protein